MKSRRLKIMPMLFIIWLLVSCTAATREAKREISSTVNRSRLISSATVGQPRFSAEGMELVTQKGHLAMFANLDTSEFVIEDLRNNKLWYSNPIDGSIDEYAQGIYRNWIYSQIAVTTNSPETNTIKTRVSYISAYKKGGISVTKTEDGIDVVYSFVKEEFTIPVSYKLLEDSFVAEVDTEKIVENGAEKVYNIKLLPMFGAQGMSANGYIVVPSGSGGRINFNNLRGESAVPYRIKMYGNDPVDPPESKTNFQETQSLPVIGMQCNQDVGLLMIADSGSANAYANASVAKQLTSYNAAYFDFDTRITQDVIIGDPRAWDHKEVLTHEKGKIQSGVAAVRYFMLDDSQTGLAGMAAVTRAYITSNRESSPNVAEKAPIFLSILGGAVKKTSVIGIPTKVTIPMTTIKDTMTIISQLQERGLENIQLIYQQWGQSQLDNKITTHMDLAGKLGKKRELTALTEKVLSLGGGLYLQTNLVSFQNSGNGVSKNGDSIRDLNNAAAEQPFYPKNVYYPAASGQTGRILNAYRAVESLEKLVKEKNQISGKIGLVIGDIGNILGGDYSSNGLRRQDAENYFGQAIKSTAKSGSLIGDNTNLYGMYDLSGIYNLPDTASEFSIIDQSVPFIQLVLHGLMPYGSRPINTAGSYEDLFLTCIATGMAPTYELIYEMPLSMRGLDQESYYGGDYSRWKETIINQYKQYAVVYKAVGTAQISGYEKLANGILKTTYNNGYITLVNQNDQPAEIDSFTVAAKSYLLIKEGEVID